MPLNKEELILLQSEAQININFAFHEILFYLILCLISQALNFYFVFLLSHFLFCIILGCQFAEFWFFKIKYTEFSEALSTLGKENHP